MRELIEAPIIQLIRTEPFFASLLMRMRLQITEKVPTAAVNVTDKVNLFVNPHFFKKLTLRQQTAVLKHEAMHIMLNHIGRAASLETTISKFNVPADVAINQMIHDIPQFIEMNGENCALATYENLVKKYPEMKANETAEYYFEFLKENQDEQEGEGEETIDDHSVWGEGCQDAEMIKEKIKEVLNKAAEEARNVGNLPGELELLIADLNRKTRNWKGDLRRFVANTSEIILEKSRKVRDRRYGIIFPGDKKEAKLKLAIAVDTSASVSDEQLNQFFAEINNICNNNAVVTIIECDATVGKVYDYKPKMKLEISGRGGTRYQPAIDKANELEVDGLIYFGDMEIFDEQLIKPKFPVLWAIVGNSKKPADWGWEIKIEVNK